MDFLFPVKLNMGKGTGMGKLIPICPHSIWCVKCLAADPLLVNIAVPFPYSLALMKSIASYKVSFLTTHTAGPKISSL